MKNNLTELKQLVQTLEALNEAIALKTATLKTAITNMEIPVRRVEDRPQPDPQSKRLTFSISETAELLGVSYSAVWNLIHRGLLKSSRALRHHLIPKKEIERFLQETQFNF